MCQKGYFFNFKNSGGDDCKYENERTVQSCVSSHGRASVISLCNIDLQFLAEEFVLGASLPKHEVLPGLLNSRVLRLFQPRPCSQPVILVEFVCLSAYWDKIGQGETSVSVRHDILLRWNPLQ